MFKIGDFQTLVINRQTDNGFYLTSKEEGEEEVLFPNKYVMSDMTIGGEVEVFLYKDGEGRFVATTEQPFFSIDQFACLDAFSVDRNGAFMEWGIEKHLFIPHKNQAERIEEGKSYIVYLYEDKITNRLVGTTRINGILKKNDITGLNEGDEVELLVRGQAELGVSFVVNNKYMGLAYSNELYGDYHMGDKVIGYVKKIRDDNKLDISIVPLGNTGIDTSANVILEELEFSNGYLPFNDKSSSDQINERFGMSKKLFKKAIGGLYKQRKILIEPEGIRLCENDE